MLTPLYRVDNAIRYKNAQLNSIWLILGKPTPWSIADAALGADGINPPSDTNIPAPVAGATSITAPICAIKATVKWVVQNVSGTYSFKDKNGNTILFSELTTSAAVLTAMSNLLMPIGTVDGTLVGALSSSYRQFGFAVNLVPTAGNETATFLSAAQVSDWGQLESIYNRTPVNLIAATSNTLKTIIPA